MRTLSEFVGWTYRLWPEFWHQFWPEAAATALGGGLGVLAALYVDRLVRRRIEAAERERRYAIRKKVVAGLIEAVGMSEFALRSLESDLRERQFIADVPLRMGVWDVLRPSAVDLIDEPQLLVRLADLFEGLAVFRRFVLRLADHHSARNDDDKMSIAELRLRLEVLDLRQDMQKQAADLLECLRDYEELQP